MTRWVLLLLVPSGCLLVWIWARRARIDRPLTANWRNEHAYERTGDRWDRTGEGW